MEKKTIPCKACGKSFVPCLTVLTESFNYKTVACSPECGREYFRLIEESRTPKAKMTAEIKETMEEPVYKKKMKFKKENETIID